MKRVVFAISALSVLGLTSCTNTGTVQSESVEAEIARAREAYLAAWTAGDVDRVMVHQAEDIALLPHRGSDPVIGFDNVREFWFPPDSPPWTVYVFDQEPIRLVHEEAIAYEYGRYTLEYAFEDADRVVDEGNYLTVWRRQPDGRWLRAAQIWNHS